MSSLLDPRPLLSISLANWNDRRAFPGVLETAPGAHHRYKVLRHEDHGFDRSDLTLLWVPMAPDPLGWIGVVNPRESARADGRVLVVFTKTKGYSARELDDLERDIRERLSDLGGNADEYRFVQEARLPQRRDGTPGSSSVIDAINAFARVENTGAHDPFLATTTRSAVSSTGRSTMVYFSVEMGEVNEGESLRLLGRQGNLPMRPRERPNVRNTQLNVAVQSLHRLDPSKEKSPSRVSQLTRFEMGKASLDGLTVDAIGALLVPPSVAVATTVKLRVSWPWSREKGFQKLVPNEGALLPTYIPGFGVPLPCRARRVEFDPDGFLVELTGLAGQPVFPGAWWLIDHATPLVYRAELIDIVN